jgi:hypothetical protein
MPVPDWIQRSWVEAGSTFSAVLLFALATVFVAVVIYPVALAATALYVCPGWSSGHHEPYERQFLGDLILGSPHDKVAPCSGTRS